MADTVVSTLYPPELDTFQPAFIRKPSDNSKINNNKTYNPVVNFSISPFNSWKNIQAIHISVVDNKTNENVLQIKANGKGWVTRNGILRISLNQISYSEETLNGTVEIPSDALIPNYIWQLNTYYKVQIRLDSSSFDDSNDYMFTKRMYFSEWSTVTLIKAIDEPIITFVDLTDDKTAPFSTYKGYYRVSGSMSFGSEEQTEYLKEYNIKIFENETDNIPIFDTGVLYAQQNYSDTVPSYTISALIDLNDTEINQTYILKISLTTNNNYNTIITKYIKIQEWYTGFFNEETDIFKWNNKGLLSDKDIYLNNEDGCAIINFTYIDKEAQNVIPNGTLYIYRSCSKDNYKTREFVYEYEYPQKDESAGISIENVCFEDYTICSLYSYKYFAQYEITKTNQWTAPVASNEIYPIFYDMLLMRQNIQIAIRYNGKISSWKPTINRQKIDTLGGKYPKFVENAMMNYKTFQISGIISAEGDYNRKFLNEFDYYEDKNNNKIYYYKDNIDKYDTTFGDSYLIRNDTYADGEILDIEKNQIYKTTKQNDNIVTITGTDIYENDNFSGKLFDQHDSYPHKNWYWERTFRDKLIEWLNDGYPKLYRSMPEGNIPVILMDIDLTPKDELGRLLYDFSATMYEVGDGYSLASLNELGIIDIPEVVFSSSDSNTNAITGFGQFIKPKDWPEDMDIINKSNSSIHSSFNQYVIASKDTQQKHSGIYSDVTVRDDSLYLENVKIYFSSSPHVYQYINGEWREIDPQDVLSSIEEGS